MLQWWSDRFLPYWNSGELSAWRFGCFARIRVWVLKTIAYFFFFLQRGIKMERAAFREKQIHKDTEVQICPIRLVLTCSELSCAPHAEFLCQNTGLFSSPINATASTFREACFHPVDFRNRRFLSLWCWVDALHTFPFSDLVVWVGSPFPALILCHTEWYPHNRARRTTSFTYSKISP